jgi:hypothetical protein
VGARPEQDEVAGRQPVEERGGLVDLGRVERRAALAVLGRERLELLAHALAVRDRRPHVAVDPVQPGNEGLAFVPAQPVDMDVDQAFARFSRGFGQRLAEEAGQRAIGPPLHREDRMGDEPRLEPALDQLGEGRVEQKRHVVVDGLEHGQLACHPVGNRLDVPQPDGACSRFARGGQEGLGVPCKLVQALRSPGCQVVGRDAPEQAAGERGLRRIGRRFGRRRILDP